MANNLAPVVERLGPVVQTTDATVTTAATFATETDKVYDVLACIIGAKSDDYSEGASYRRAATFKNDGGTLSLVGSITDVHTAENDASWDATLDADGTDIRVRVTGDADTTINWRVVVDIQEVE